MRFRVRTIHLFRLKPEQAGPRDEQRTFSRRRTNISGAAIVAACFALPLLLTLVTGYVEGNSAERFLSASRVPRPAPTAVPLAWQHYYYVNGCVSDPWNCDTASHINWGQYYLHLEDIYRRLAPLDPSAEPLEEWAATHVHYISSRTSTDGAFLLEQALAANEDARSIHLIGTSTGGSAVLTYLTRAMQERVPLDARIRSAAIVDAPLGFQFPLTSSNLGSALQAGIMKSDIGLGIGEWARNMQISLFAVNVPHDIVGHDPVPGLPTDIDPIYPQPDPPKKPIWPATCETLVCRLGQLMESITVRSAWHDFTGGHISVQIAEFMDREWGR